MIAPSLAAAFLGCLAFAAYLIHLRRVDVAKAAKAMFFSDSTTLIRRLEETDRNVTVGQRDLYAKLEELQDAHAALATAYGERVGKLEFLLNINPEEAERAAQKAKQR